MQSAQHLADQKSPEGFIDWQEIASPSSTNHQIEKVVGC
jgi:hypothetical protein